MSAGFTRFTSIIRRWQRAFQDLVKVEKLIKWTPTKDNLKKQEAKRLEKQDRIVDDAEEQQNEKDLYKTSILTMPMQK